MLYFDKTDMFLKVVMLIRPVKESIICHYWYFLDKEFTFQLNFCNRCHDLLMISINLMVLLFYTLMVLINVVLLAELANVKT